MELLVTLRNRTLLERIAPFIDGVIVGKHFATGYHYSLDDLVILRAICKRLKLRFYIVMDQFISEDKKILLSEYLNFIDSLDVDGIYFHDLGVYEASRSDNLTSRLIYDGKTVLCNSLDTLFLLEKGINSVVLSRELTLEEITRIVQNAPHQVDLQIFGHLRMSSSKRRFLRNYFDQIHQYHDYLEKETLYLIEEKRDYRMPILETEAGTEIYTDYIFEMFRELPQLRDNLKRGIIDTLFIRDDTLIVQACRDYRRIDDKNKDFLRDSLMQNYPESYSSGYLYQKTNISKDEQD